MGITSFSILGAGGMKLHGVEAGNPNGPAVLFIHGFSQSHRCWVRQLQGELARKHRLVAIDVRGHGFSEKPIQPRCYQDSQLWAEDIQVVIEALGLQNTVLVAWSYAGLVACDYLRHYGDEHLGGLMLVAAATHSGNALAKAHTGPAIRDHFPGMLVCDFQTQYRSTYAFASALTYGPLSLNDFGEIMAASMMTPPQVRSFLLARRLTNDDVLKNVRVPVCLVHSRDDQLILPAASEHTLSCIPQAQVSWYEQVGHAPFLESAGRFNQELSSFVAQVHSCQHPSVSTQQVDQSA